MRRKKFQNVVSIIKFEKLLFLDNTVIFVKLRLAMTIENINVKFIKYVNTLFNDRFAKICNKIKCIITENVFKVFYFLLFNNILTPCRWLSKIREKIHIYNEIYRIQFQNENEIYIYNEIENLLYKSFDINVFL